MDKSASQLKLPVKPVQSIVCGESPTLLCCTQSLYPDMCFNKDCTTHKPRLCGNGGSYTRAAAATTVAANSWVSTLGFKDLQLQTKLLTSQTSLHLHFPHSDPRTGTFPLSRQCCMQRALCSNGQSEDAELHHMRSKMKSL